MKTEAKEEKALSVALVRPQHENPGRSASAQVPVTSGPVELLREPYPGDPTREIVLLRATFSPGDSTPPHRHPGFLVGYILTGELEFQLGGQSLQRLAAGDRFFEPPQSMHIVSRNPGETATQVLAFIVREKGSRVMIPLDDLNGQGDPPTPGFQLAR